MLKVSSRAVALLKAAKRAEGASRDAGIRIRHSNSDDSRAREAISIGFAISEEPVPSDEWLEQDGLRIFVEDKLTEPLDGRTLDVRDANEGIEFIFR
jgi:Fe-S cluster assembly iron-binding protein IscA